eukprot:6491790-Amphidinium_carterae.3
MSDPAVLEEKRRYSIELQALFQQYSQALMAEGGEISLEWPAFCDGWDCDSVQAFTDCSAVTSVICHGCMFGLVTPNGQRPMKKPFRIASTNPELTRHMANFRCDRSHEHAMTQGSDTVKTGNYNERFCQEVLTALDGNGTPGSRAGVPASVQVMETQVPTGNFYSGKEKNGYTVDSVKTAAWMDVLEIDYQRKLRMCENHSDSYQTLLQTFPYVMEPLGEIKSLYDAEGSVSINVTNALQDQEVPDFFATPVMKPLTLDAHVIFDDPIHRQGWIDAAQAELDSFAMLQVMDDVPDKGQKAIPSQLVATVKPSNAVITLLESETRQPKPGDSEQQRSSGEQVTIPDAKSSNTSKESTKNTDSTAKDQEGCPHFVIEYPVFPPSAAKKGKNHAKNVKNKQEKRFTEQGMNEEVYSKGKKKVRIVCCGNVQKVCDFEETSTQTPPFSMLRLALAMVSVFGWMVASADISIAFLYASLHQDDVVLGFETIYVRPPKVLVTIGLVLPNILWKLKKSLYGLRTSPLAWERERDRTISTLSWTINDVWYCLARASPCVWKIIRWDHYSQVGDKAGAPGSRAGDPDLPVPLGFFIAYVDDLLAVAREEHLIAIMHQLKIKYSMKMTGTLTFPKQQDQLPLTFLGCSVWRDEVGTLWMSQIKYIYHCLRENGWIQDKQVILKKTATLPAPDEKREDEDEVDEDARSQCQKYIGQLMWLATRTRPDISACLGILATFMVKRPRECVHCLLHLWRYVYTTSDLTMITAKYLVSRRHFKRPFI